MSAKQIESQTFTMVAGTISLFSVYKLRRYRRSVEVLGRMLDRATDEATQDTDRGANQPQEWSQ